MARVRVAKPTASRSMSRNASSDAARDASLTADATPLLDLGPLEEGVLVCRPSVRNRSPYVGDVRLVSGPNAGSTCVTHLPNLDSGGKCRPGVRLLCRRQPGVGPDTVGKFGTPKCELICQLLRCEEPENGAGVWVSAHPAIGEKLTQALMRRGAFDDRLFMRVGKSPAKKNPDTATKGKKNPSATENDVVNDDAEDALSSPVSSQVSRKREASLSASGSFRPDFSVEHPDGSATVVECKQVVDTDYDPETALVAAEKQPGHPVYAIRSARDALPDKSNTNTKKTPYVRAGIFPWGARGQKGPDGEPVVSRRAIDHLRELSVIARGEVTKNVEDTTKNSEGTTKKPINKTRAAVVLMAGRHDVFSIRANGAACPSFAKHVLSATSSGVLFMGHKVRWGEGLDLGKAFDAGPVPIEAPTIEGDEVVVPRPAKEKKKRSPAESKEPATRKNPKAKATAAKKKGGGDEGDAETSATAKRRRRGNTS